MFKKIAGKTNSCKSMIFCWNILIWWKYMVNYFLFSQKTRLAEFFVKFSRRYVFTNGVYWHFSQSFIFILQSLILFRRVLFSRKKAKKLRKSRQLISQIINLVNVSCLLTEWVSITFVIFFFKTFVEIKFTI